MEAAGIEPACSDSEPVEHEQLTALPKRRSVDWEHPGDPSWPILTPDDTTVEDRDRQLQYVAQAWSRLPPHVRQTILTLVNAAQ